MPPASLSFSSLTPPGTFWRVVKAFASTPKFKTGSILKVIASTWEGSPYDGDLSKSFQFATETKATVTLGWEAHAEELKANLEPVPKSEVFSTPAKFIKLAAKLEDPDRVVRGEALYRLNEEEVAALFPIVLDMVLFEKYGPHLDGRQRSVGGLAQDALVRNGKPLLGKIEEAYDQAAVSFGDYMKLREVLLRLGSLPLQKTLLEEVIAEEKPAVLARIFRELGDLGHPESIPILEKHLSSQNWNIREAAREAIEKCRRVIDPMQENPSRRR
jgi:hypothetical protein